VEIEDWRVGCGGGGENDRTLVKARENEGEERHGSRVIMQGRERRALNVTRTMRRAGGSHRPLEIDLFRDKFLTLKLILSETEGVDKKSPNEGVGNENP
jgi:hypothetical protein